MLLTNWLDVSEPRLLQARLVQVPSEAEAQRDTPVASQPHEQAELLPAPEVTPSQPEPVATSAPDLEPPPEPQAEPHSEPVAESAATQTPEASEDSSATQPAQETPELNEALDEGEIKPPAFSEVKTEFDVFMNDETSRVGTATIHYKALEDARYLLTWKVEATGLLGLLYPNLVQTSEGKITEFGLQPSTYRYQFGNKDDKTYEAQFNWSDKLVVMKTSKGEKLADIADNVQDLLSFMYQFMYVPPLSNMQIHLTNGKKLAVYDYAFDGEETLSLKWGEVKTYHIMHAKTDSDDKTELWLASEYQFVPVKIRKTEQNGTVIEQVATSISAQ
jgi:hypothetical protein